VGNTCNAQPVIIISGKNTGNFKQEDVIKFSIANNSLCEFADESGNPKENVVLRTSTIEFNEGQYIENIERISNNDLLIFPNPAEDLVKIRYNIPNDGFVKISLYNVLGEKLADVVNNYGLKGINNSDLNLSSIPSGVYSIKMVLEDKSLVVIKH
jgi:hypothetical protein